MLLLTATGMDDAKDIKRSVSAKIIGENLEDMV